jgi:hypothetical protein
MVGPSEGYVGFTISGDALPHVQRFKRDRWYFLFGIIPIWCVTEQHDVYDPYPNRLRGAEDME